MATGPAGAVAFRDLGEPLAVLEARRAAAVPSLLAEIERAASAGLIAAGFVTYEAAPAFDPGYLTAPLGGLPPAWFALFEPEAARRAGTFASGEAPELVWQPTIEAGDHAAGVARIREWIAAGDTYQVNFSFRLRAPFTSDPWDLFAMLNRGQETPYAAYLDLGGHAIASVSPELFFELHDDRIRCRPMKGTAPRGLWPDEDRRQAERLRASAKERAENLMIVDMVRNDLGRVARPGSVEVASLFDVEQHPSLFQLTSTVEAHTDAAVAEVFAALFPSASITGAPKVAAMGKIAALEVGPRGIYTGAIGTIGPGRRARFNVAIRTVHVDREHALAEYGTGGGIVWDSTSESEFAECRTKALVLAPARTRFDLFETLRWDPVSGYARLERHLDRLGASASYFSIPFDRAAALATLRAAAELDALSRVRLRLDSRGRMRLEVEPLPADRSWSVALASDPINRHDVRVFHKTTDREPYDAARRLAPGYDDVLLWNEQGELTESTVANLVLEIDGEKLTPPVESGLLAGTLRAELLDRGEIRERRLMKRDLERAERVWLVNSLRGWIAIEIDRAPLSRGDRAPAVGPTSTPAHSARRG